MKQAVALGCLDERTAKGPAQPPKAETHEETAKEVKKRRATAQKRNIRIVSHG